MLIAERTYRADTRPSHGFSLGEATRIRRDLLSKKSDIHCPRCGDLLASVSAQAADLVWMATCNGCRASVVVHVEASELR